MNLQLMENFGQNFPEEFEGYLDFRDSLAVCCKFNRWGSLLAVGCNDGRIAIFDFMTRGLVRDFRAHVQQVVSLSWSRNGRRLLTLGADQTASIWDLLRDKEDTSTLPICLQRFVLPLPAVKAYFNPRNELEFLVCPIKGQCLLMDVESGNMARKVPLVPASSTESGDEYQMVSVFNRRGDCIITGDPKGRIGIFNSKDLNCITFVRMGTAHAIKFLATATKSDYFLTICGDKIIRVYDLREVLLLDRDSVVECIHKLQDRIDNSPWKACCFSSTADYICAAKARSHALHIWERSSGSLVKIIEGTKGEHLLDFAWHPSRPLICSLASGGIYIWSQTQVENWSAFAPDFKELDENVIYEERESEFDIEDEDKSVTAEFKTGEEEESQIDIETTEKPAIFCSSDEEETTGPPSDYNRDISQIPRNRQSPLLFLPVHPEAEVMEELSSSGQTSGNMLSPSHPASGFVSVTSPIPSNTEFLKNRKVPPALETVEVNMDSLKTESGGEESGATGIASSSLSASQTVEKKNGGNNKRDSIPKTAKGPPAKFTKKIDKK